MSMFKKTLVIVCAGLLTAVSSLFADIPCDAYTVTQNVVYDNGHSASCRGDLYLPEGYGPYSPVLLLIHGGAWNSMSRADVASVAKYFARDLGFVVYNIDYRLVNGSSVLWPACADDCVKAAKYLLSQGFHTTYGLANRRVWICGASSGGHLALWTLVNLPREDVEGCISISSIGAPAIDYAANPTRYSPLFGTVTQEALASMDPCSRILGSSAPLLCTHATEDSVVPIASHRAFATAYTAAGNSCTFYEYSSSIETALTGHCIWQAYSDPNELIIPLKSQIAAFVGNVRAAGELVSRQVRFVSATYGADGTPAAANLAFGPANGHVNSLYIAYGAEDAGTSTNGWENVDYLGTVEDTDATRVVNIPSGYNCVRFFLVTPTGVAGEPVEYVRGDGTHYLDCGFKVHGGDAVTLRIRQQSEKKSDNQAVFGYRSTVDKSNVTLSSILDGLILDYVDSNTSGAYADYRCHWQFTNRSMVNHWVDAVLRPSERSCSEGGVLRKSITSLAEMEFETGNVHLFHVAGNPSATVSAPFTGDIDSFTVRRNNSTIADYMPYRQGTTYGFLDRVSGNFLGIEGFTGGEALTFDPFTTCSGAMMAKTHARTVSIAKCAGRKVMLEFGPGNGLTNRLYCAWGHADGGNTTNGWDNCDYIDDVTPEVASQTYTVTDEARRVRFFLRAVLNDGICGEALEYVSTEGSAVINLDFAFSSRDDICIMISPAVRSQYIFGMRTDVNTKDIIASTSGNSFCLDFCGQDSKGNSATYSDYRLQPIYANNWYEGKWYEVRASAAARSVTGIDNDFSATSTTVCPHIFTTTANGKLFSGSGNSYLPNNYKGKCSGFSVERDSFAIADFVPYVIDGQVGFIDRATGTFKTSNGLTASAAKAAVDPLLSSTDSVKIRTGLAVFLY